VSSKRHVCMCVDTSKQLFFFKKKLVSEGGCTPIASFLFRRVHTRREKEFVFLVTTALVKTLQNTHFSLSLSLSLSSFARNERYKKKRDGGERRRNTKKRSNSEEEEEDDDDGALERARGVRRFCVFVRAIFAIEARSSAVRCWR